MLTARFSVFSGLLGLFVLFAAPAELAAQRFPGFGSLEGRVGAYFPEDADIGYGFSVDAGLGYLGSPFIRTLIGFNYFTADADRQVRGIPLEGSFAAAGGRIGVRLDPFGAARFTPYLAGTLTGHSVSTDPDDPADEDLFDDVYDGFVVGASLGVGLTYSLDLQDRYAITAEGRRLFANDIGNWAVEVGIRLTPRGRDAYLPVYDPDVFVFDDREEIARTAAERERLRLERERLEEERLRNEEGRLSEAERLRAEEERRLAEQATEEERRRAREETERLRQQADTLALAREREAAARAQAEAEAERLRAEAGEARRAAEEARMRAEQAERQLYDQLLNLDRLIANITEIRETERGLAVVLGQGLFASGQSALSARARDEVGRIAAVLQQFSEREIVIEGHTDAVGSEVSNQRLAEARAEAVRAALIAEGINPGRTRAVGYGESQPIASNETSEGRAQNRRVEIVVIGAQRPAPR